MSSSAQPGQTPEPVVHVARFTDLTPHQLYGLLRLRVDVFVVEQDCPYPELDGRDTEATAEHLWVEAEGRPVATLRLLSGASGTGEMVIGRVATDREHRGHGYAAALVREALRRSGPRPVRIGAQAYLEGWYGQFGFDRCGPDYLEDGIPHLPMLRPPTTEDHGAHG